MLHFTHTPVLLEEVLEYLAPKKGGTYLDGTLGRGGHTEAILERIGSTGKMFVMDQDPEAIELSKKRLERFNNVTYVMDNFANMANYVEKGSLDGILLDLGVSSPQLDDAARGFSWTKEGPLDMRMSKETSGERRETSEEPIEPATRLSFLVSEHNGRTAKKILDTYTAQQLTQIFTEYGEERYARKIAQAIVHDRGTAPFTTTKQFADMIFRVAPGSREQKKASVMRIFQAIRIEVNAELKALEEGLHQGLSLLKDGGRFVVISFHSLEDRIVKQFFQRESKACICPPELPICQCKHKAELKILTKKPITASENELKANPRSAPAKLRAAEKQ